MNDEYDLDNEEMYGELSIHTTDDTNEPYTINPITGQRHYLDDDEMLDRGLYDRDQLIEFAYANLSELRDDQLVDIIKLTAEAQVEV